MERLEFIKDKVFYLPKWWAWTAWLGFWIQFWNRPAIIAEIKTK